MKFNAQTSGLPNRNPSQVVLNELAGTLPMYYFMICRIIVLLNRLEGGAAKRYRFALVKYLLLYPTNILLEEKRETQPICITIYACASQHGVVSMRWSCYCY